MLLESINRRDKDLKGNKTNHKRIYLRQLDWDNWLNTDWRPFKQNDLPHLQKKITTMQTDISWLKKLMIGLILIIISAAIAIILKG